MWVGFVFRMAEQTEACVVLPQQREAMAHFACQDSGPMEAEVGGSAYCLCGNAHLSIDVSTNLRVGFLPFLGSAKFWLLCHQRSPSVDTTNG
jgi:hypothetical protein